MPPPDETRVAWTESRVVLDREILDRIIDVEQAAVPANVGIVYADQHVVPNRDVIHRHRFELRNVVRARGVEGESSRHVPDDIA